MQLKTSCLLNVPFQTYDNDFTFIVNDKEFKTSRFVSDLLSPVICQNHLKDPTFDIFSIKTSHDGDFSHILNLVNFSQVELQEEEYPFISEVIEILGNESIELSITINKVEITKDNFIDLLLKHEKYSKLHHKDFSDIINFVSSHFFELCESHAEHFKRLHIETLEEIISSPNLQIKDEDQLLHFINKLCQSDAQYSCLYEFVYFVNVSVNGITEFTDNTSIEDITSAVWQKVSARLKCEITKPKESGCVIKSRYKKSGLLFEVKEHQELAGIINYLYTKSNGKIDDEIDFTSSSNHNGNNPDFVPRTVALFDDHERHFVSGNKPGSWICLDFKKHRIIPTDYTIRSCNCGPNNGHPRSWVVECSNDNNKWTVIDKRENDSNLNGTLYVSTFKIQQGNSEEYRYIRIRQTGKNWRNYDYLFIDSFEIYGTYI